MLPPAALGPYLRAIGSARWYSNSGPLATGLEERLADYLGVPEDGVVTVANGTLGLTLALLALEAKPGTLCMMPSWTFAAGPEVAAPAQAKRQIDVSRAIRCHQFCIFHQIARR